MLTAKDASDIPKMLIFTQTKDMTCKVYSFLMNSVSKKHWIGMYHASLTQVTKSFIQRQFQNDESELRCSVATIAFGMVCSTCMHVYCSLMLIPVGLLIYIFL